MIKKVLTYPHPKLRQKARQLSPEDIKSKEIQQLIEDLIDTMLADDGIGIAATQVGAMHQIFILGNGKDKTGARAFINPVIVSSGSRETFMEEGCLSVPGVFGLVKRPSKVRMKALDINGKKVDIKTSGLTAKVFQHEIDHLNGILFIDKVERITRGSISDLEKGIISKMEKPKDIAL